MYSLIIYNCSCILEFLSKITSGTLRTLRKRWRNNATKDAAFVCFYERCCFSDVMSYWKNETKYSDQHVYIGIRNLSCSACIDYGNAYIWINADFHDCRTFNPVGYCYRFCFFALLNSANSRCYFQLYICTSLLFMFQNTLL